MLHRSVKPMTGVVGVMLLLSGCERIDVREGPAPGVRVQDPRAPYATVRMNTVNIIDKSLQNW